MRTLFIMSSSGLTSKQTAVSASDNDCVEGPPLWSVVETITVSQPSTGGSSGDVDGDGLDDLLTAANGYQGLNGTAASISEAAVNHSGGTTSWQASSSGVTGATPPPTGTTGNYADETYGLVGSWFMRDPDDTEPLSVDTKISVAAVFSGADREVVVTNSYTIGKAFLEVTWSVDGMWPEG